MMAHTREQDRHRSPISISFSSSPSPPPASSNKANTSLHPQRVLKLQHQSASSAQPREIASHGRMQQWMDDLPHGLELNSVSVGAQPVASIADFAYNTGHPPSPPSVNAGGQLVPQVPGLIYNTGPPQAPLHALVPRPMPNNAEPVAGYGRRLSMNLPELDRRPRVRGDRGNRGNRGNPYKSERADGRLPVQTLPFNIKHSILCAMQKIMEAALFYWAKHWVPLLLQKEGWDTPEAGELNHWLRTMNKYPIPPEAFSHSAGMNEATLGQLLTRRLHYIRHAAVHRDPTITVSALKEMLADAHFLTQGLRDAPRTNKLQAMQLALEGNDRKRIEETIAAPISTFDDGFGPHRVRTQPRPSENGLQQKENIQFSGRGNYASKLGNSSGILQSVEGQETMVHGRGRSVQRGLRDSNGRPQGLKRKRSETIKFERANQKPRVIQHPGEHIDLTVDSDDGDPPATNPKPAKIARVIDLTGDEPIVLFRSPRASEATEAHM